MLRGRSTPTSQDSNDSDGTIVRSTDRSTCYQAMVEVECDENVPLPSSPSSKTHPERLESISTTNTDPENPIVNLAPRHDGIVAISSESRPSSLVPRNLVDEENVPIKSLAGGKPNDAERSRGASLL